MDAVPSHTLDLRYFTWIEDCIGNARIRGTHVNAQNQLAHWASVLLQGWHGGEGRHEALATRPGTSLMSCLNAPG